MHRFVELTLVFVLGAGWLYFFEWSASDLVWAAFLYNIIVGVPALMGFAYWTGRKTVEARELSPQAESRALWTAIYVLSFILLPTLAMLNFFYLVVLSWLFPLVDAETFVPTVKLAFQQSLFILPLMIVVDWRLLRDSFTKAQPKAIITLLGKVHGLIIVVSVLGSYLEGVASTIIAIAFWLVFCSHFWDRGASVPG